MNIIAIIPARYASSRFPGKPLALLQGKPVIQHVYEKVAAVIPDTCVATDDNRIKECVESFGGRVVMTRSTHQSGTDRIAEAVANLATQHDIVLNVQGDEPFISPEQINTVCQLFQDPLTQIGTLGKPFTTMSAVDNPNSPKIVTDNKGFALYFSRSVIPFVRSEQREDWLSSFCFLKHIGIYAYRKPILNEITQLPQSPLEIAEGLEQLRWLQNGYKIKVGLTNIETVGIDTPDDLQQAEDYLRQMNIK